MVTKLVSKATGKAVVGTTTIQKGKNGLPEVDTENISQVLVDAGATVGLSIGKTYNLGNFESLRVDVSISMPSGLKPEELTDTYNFCDVWASAKLGEVEEQMLKAKEG